MKSVGIAALLSGLVITAAHAGGFPQFGPSEKVTAEIYAQHGSHLLERTLNDFPSARIRNVYAVSQTIPNTKDTRVFTFCGEINSKNGFGGYSGWQMFEITQTYDGPFVGPLAIHFENDGTGAIFIGIDCFPSMNLDARLDKDAAYTQIVLGTKKVVSEDN